MTTALELVELRKEIVKELQERIELAQNEERRMAYTIAREVVLALFRRVES